MRFLISILILFVAGFALQIFTPWWSIVILAFFVSGFLNRNAGLAFIAGLIGVYLLWTGYVFILDNQILSEKLAGLFGLPSGLILKLVSGLVAAIPSAIASMSGSWFFDLFRDQQVRPELELNSEPEVQ